MLMAAQGGRLFNREVTAGEVLLTADDAPIEITGLLLTNTTTNVASVWIHHLSAGETPRADNALFGGLEVADRYTYTVLQDLGAGFVLRRGESLYGRAAEGRITITGYGTAANIAPGG